MIPTPNSMAMNFTHKLKISFAVTGWSSMRISDYKVLSLPVGVQLKRV